MSIELWWLAYLTAGVAVGAWLWHTSHDEIEQALGDVPFVTPRVAAVALTVYYGVSVAVWPLVVLVELFEWVRWAIDHALYRIHVARCAECRGAVGSEWGGPS